ncbi:MAG TPA: isocitrate lyase/phosphoenolpyruvate mutase family protein [Rhizobiales bacterium]|nr:isocitrate lyase/phosphoenolpyruvate mutase family protein [Hyphomicrobiales bacterium]
MIRSDVSLSSQIRRAKDFADLHIKGDPLILYNIWDAGSANAVQETGAKAVATGSWSVAGAQGYPDGEKLPLDFLLMIVTRIVESVNVPLSVDFEGGYATEPEELAANVAKILGTGAIGINFEDQLVGSSGLYDIKIQSDRIKAIRSMADEAGIPLFINARTDLFLKEKDRNKHKDLIGEAKDRVAAYAEAGASSFFVPALFNTELINDVCANTELPVNVMKLDNSLSNKQLADCGVARISYGPGPFRQAMQWIAQKSQVAISD